MTALDEEAEGWGASADASSVALFGGDAGALSFEQRRCLVRLLKERYLSKDVHPQLWEVLLRDEAVLRSRLNDLFLTLHVDRHSEVAYKRQAIPDESQKRFPTLLHDTAYTREETVLLVFLRQRLQSERAAGADRVLVDVEDLVERVGDLRPADATDRSGDERRAVKAVEAMCRYGVLRPSGEPDRFEVSPVLDALLPLPRLKELLDWLRSESQPGEAADAGEPETQADEAESHA